MTWISLHGIISRFVANMMRGPPQSDTEPIAKLMLNSVTALTHAANSGDFTAGMTDQSPAHIMGTIKHDSLALF